MTQAAACPNCGGTRLERDQPSPTHSDGDVMNAVDPSTGIDQGGNPLQEGIWATTDGGWQPFKRRDESFASVKMAGLTVQPGGTAGIHAGPLSLLGRLPTITIDGQPVNEHTFNDHFNKYGSPHSPHFMKPVQVDSYHPAFTDLARRIIEDGHGHADHYKDDVQGIQAQMAAGTIPKPPVVSAVVLSEEDQEAASRKQWANNKKLRYQLIQAGLKGHQLGWTPGMHGRGLMIGPYLHTWNAYDPKTVMDDYDTGVHHSEYGRALNDNHGIEHDRIDYASGIEITPEGHVDQLGGRDIASYQQIDSRLQPKQNTWAFGSHQIFTDKTGKTFLIDMSEPIVSSSTTYSRSLDMEPHMPWTHEITKIAGPALALGGVALRAAAPALMSGALRGIGSQGIQGLMGEDGAGQMPSMPPPPRDPSLLSSVHEADIETPSSNPGFHDSPDGDTHQFSDGDTDPNFNNPNNDDSGPSGEDEVRDQAGFGPNSAGLERVELLAPLLLHYYHSEESGIGDPLIKELHEQLEQENPGYLSKGDEAALKALLEEAKKPQGVHAKTAAPGVGMATPMGQPGLQQAVPAPTPQTTQPANCPFCGGVTVADGSCPQCGAQANPMGGSVPPNVSQGQPMPYGGRMGASHQGPVTDEQKSAVAELLIETQRHEEIPSMLQEPWNYAEEMAQIANKVNQPPNVDPNDPAPPAPAQEVAPPGATMPMPNPADPSGGNMMQAKVAADSLTPRCPECGSGTTGMLNADGECRCHACNNVWTEKNTVVDDIDNTKTTKVAFGEAPPAPAEKNPESIPAADHEQRADDAGQEDSSHTWQSDDGTPLEAGGEYEMHSPQYQIPDIIKVVAVKPDAITIETIGEYDNTAPSGQEGQTPAPLSYQHEVTKEEADMDGLTFTPSSGDSNAGEQSLDQYSDSTQAPVHTQAQPQPAIQQPRSHVEPVESHVQADDDMCPKCANTHISSSMSSETTSFHECFRCGHGWETKEEEYSREAQVDLSWINEDSGPGGDDFFAEMERHKAMRAAGSGSRSLSDIASRDDRLQAIKSTLDQNAQSRVAGKKFTPREQREFIDERGVARNSDKLDLMGTHYETRYLGPKANGENVKDEELFLGI